MALRLRARRPCCSVCTTEILHLLIKNDSALPSHQPLHTTIPILLPFLMSLFLLSSLSIQSPAQQSPGPRQQFGTTKVTATVLAKRQQYSRGQSQSLEMLHQGRNQRSLQGDKTADNKIYYHQILPLFFPLLVCLFFSSLFN